jgi:dimethylamine corrinoid protein
MNDLIASVLMGDCNKALEHANRLLEQGVQAQAIVVDGLAAAMLELDSKCSVEDFDLLQIMLAGRCVMRVIDTLFSESESGDSWSKGVAVLGTIKGDVHDLGKNIAKAVFTGAGYQIVDLGTGVTPERFVESALQSQADFILVSSLLTTTLRHIQPIRGLLPSDSNVTVVAGGSAVEQVPARELDVDHTASNVFDGLRFCDSKVGSTI